MKLDILYAWKFSIDQGVVNKLNLNRANLDRTTLLYAAC